ncbi:MAG TPA: class 1 fructose-bisphosphatase [Nitrososphaerales archaeon]|nr:class 1 fructose-bisphosphatase [Nitrososphaerales archaeon]
MAGVSSQEEQNSASFLEEGLSDVEGDVSKVYGVIAKTAQAVSKQLPFRFGVTKNLNPFGERQSELDVFANESFSRALLDTGRVGWVASEEMETPLGGFTQRSDSISVAMDPLDGSSNITTNNPLGSIFGIWRGELPKRGRDLAASAFVTYGPTLTITLVCGGRVDQYVELRDGENTGRFALAYKDMKLPQKPEIYGVAGTRSQWIPAVERFVRNLEAREMRLRHSGTFIADYNQVMQRGGIFSHPAHRSKPEGKLRVCYETASVSFLTEVAGGKSSDGKSSILDIYPKKLTQTSPFYVGNTALVKELENEIANG